MNVTRRDLIKLLAIAAGAGLAPRELEAADGAMLQKAVESDLGPALASLGYTVLTEENAQVLLKRNSSPSSAMGRFGWRSTSR